MRPAGRDTNGTSPRMSTSRLIAIANVLAFKMLWQLSTAALRTRNEDGRNDMERIVLSQVDEALILPVEQDCTQSVCIYMGWHASCET